MTDLILQAKNQAKRYSKGSLSSLELSSVRYLVIVSEKHVKDLPSEINEDNLIYRIVNIAYNPSTPSKS